VAFEDLRFPGSDFNYNDESFVFTDVSSRIVATPEPMSMALVGSGLVGLVARRYRRKQTR
jgi:hypothetical protein